MIISMKYLNKLDIKDGVKRKIKSEIKEDERNEREEIMEKIGITSEYIDECMIERYWMNVYRLGLENEEN